MNNKRGFTLIEVVITLVLSSFIISMLFSAFFIINRAISVVEPLMNNDVQKAVFFNQMSKDIQGAFIPSQASPVAKSSVSPTNNSPEKNEKTASPAVLDKVFYTTLKDDNVEILTFITNNPLQFYTPLADKSNKAALVRVVYKLQKEENKNTFRLMRAQLPTLHVPAVSSLLKTSQGFYEILNGIKSLKIKYSATFYNEKKELTLHECTQWDYDAWFKKDPKTRLFKIPQYVGLSITFDNDVSSAADSFELLLEIPTYSALLISEVTKPAPLGAAAEAKPLAGKQLVTEQTTKLTIPTWEQFHEILGEMRDKKEGKKP